MFCVLRTASRNGDSDCACWVRGSGLPGRRAGRFFYYSHLHIYETYLHISSSQA